MFNKLLYKYINRIMVSDPQRLVTLLRQCYGPGMSNLLSLSKDLIPKSVEGFHDLSYLFACNQANRGIIAQDFDEAAYLWKVVVDNKPAKMLEIGRWLGGSTILLVSAAALHGGKVVSVDLKVKCPEYAQDEVLKKHLAALGLSNYELVIASGHDFKPTFNIDMAFIDGDHSYEGVRKDFENVMKYLSDKADIVFHDSCKSRPHATCHDGVAKLMNEIKEMTGFVLKKQVGSISHFKFDR